MEIKIVSESEDVQRGRTLVSLIIDGKKKKWNMSNGLWEFVKYLIEDKND